MDAILWLLNGIWSGIAGPVHVLMNLGTVFDFSDPENLMRVIYYGASAQIFFFFFNVAVVVFLVGLWRREFLWGVVRGLEGFANVVGRTAAWAGLLMVLQQIMVIFLQSIFRASDISVGPVGVDLTQTVAWYSDSLKFYNAIIVCMCVSYTFVQGGHVRVDLFYASFSHRAKRVVDMFGSLFFMIPATALTWYYAWYFLWRHLITPPVNASDTLDRTLAKARAVRWNIETTGFSPNGFNAYFLFKVLILIFCAMVLVQAIAFFYRSYLEYVEGESSAGKYLDKDKLGDDDAELVAQIH
ncbi:TRAP transporter small permease subunit [Palleronia sp. KMU-117]|uniref:TRAP transporter small permease subunit n=1 Tax=Palleronia sp. KMU-117 TaxID=3434108 RepID=UPI003D716606